MNEPRRTFCVSCAERLVPKPVIVAPKAARAQPALSLSPGWLALGGTGVVGVVVVALFASGLLGGQPARSPGASPAASPAPSSAATVQAPASPVPSPAPSPDPLSGAWRSVDVDGSNQTLIIDDPAPDGTRLVALADDAGAVCGGQPVKAEGLGRSQAARLTVTITPICADGSALDPVTLEYVYDPATNTLFDGTTTWTRSG